jgi:hypothetical protein
MQSMAWAAFKKRKRRAIQFSVTDYSRRSELRRGTLLFYPMQGPARASSCPEGPVLPLARYLRSGHAPCRVC